MKRQLAYLAAFAVLMVLPMSVPAFVAGAPPAGPAPFPSLQASLQTENEQLKLRVQTLEAELEKTKKQNEKLRSDVFILQSLLKKINSER